MLTQTTDSFFTREEIEQLNVQRVPHHIAFIPDGNRRWAKAHSFDVTEGHRKGSDNIITIVKAAKEMGVKAVTYYLFSTENWTRPRLEISALMWLLQKYLVEKTPEMIENGARLHTIGDLTRFSAATQKALADCKQATAHCNAIDMIFALNYGSRDEIRRAVQHLSRQCLQGQLTPDQITEELISKSLDTAAWPDPDLLIRTSGEKRISNYLLWQLSYTELYPCDILWPDFNPRHLLQAVIDFQKRERRLGGP